MSPSVKQVFAKGCADLKIDRAFIRRLSQYTQNFANKNEDHIAFFGGNLMGVHPVRFRPEDRNRWFDDILIADEAALEEDLHTVDAVYPPEDRAAGKEVRKVSGDIMNMSFLWLTHAIYSSPHLSASEKEAGMHDTILMMQYKFITSILAFYFRHPADEAVAVATYAALTKKYGLKVYGSWGALLDARTKDILAKNSIHYKTITHFDDDFKIVYMCNDIQGRIKSIINNIRDVFETIRLNPKASIRSTSSMVTFDGVTSARDKQRQFQTYRRYIHTVISDKPSYIREELVKIVSNAMPVMPEKLLRDALDYTSVNYGPRGDKEIETLVDDVLTHAFDTIAANRSLMGSNLDVGAVIAKLRSLYMASRSSDPLVLGMRTLSEKIVRRCVKSKNDAVIAAVRTGLCLYIVLRTFSMNFYSR